MFYYSLLCALRKGAASASLINLFTHCLAPFFAWVGPPAKWVSRITPNHLSIYRNVPRVIAETSQSHQLIVTFVSMLWESHKVSAEVAHALIPPTANEHPALFCLWQWAINDCGCD